jgi:hypothetical protein
MPSRDEYPDDAVQACFSVLVELFTYLKPYRDYIVLIGGWVPFFLTQDRTEDPHIGSLDIDLALDANRIPETGYVTILTVLETRGYHPARNRNAQIIPARYERLIEFASGRTYPIRVDFLAPEYGGTERQHRHQKVQELLARKARGSDLVFTHFIEFDLVGRLPNQAENRERIKIANPAACLVMKAIVFGERSAEKDAYDLYMLCDTLGVQTMVEQLVPLKENRLLQEALAVLREKFSSPNTLGPTSIAEFMKTVGEEAERLKRRAFELFQAILSALSHGP